MDYDVVIATRNRPQTLELSIPLILQQDRKPNKLIVVDASDDPEPSRSVTERLLGGDSGIRFEFILADAPNSSRQRNLGLARVESPVVMFPDDDSLWYPGVAEAIMSIYELDDGWDIAGVCACPADAKTPPPGVRLPSEVGTRMRISDRIRQRIAGLRYKFDSHFCPHPLYVYGKSCWDVRQAPKWLSHANATVTTFMTGLCMSFRTELVRKHGFDEDLGAYIGWAAYEDAACSFQVMQERLVVEAHDARVYHHKFPGARAGGFEVGFINWFNCAYILCRYAPLGSKAYRALKRYGKYKLIQYLLAANTRFGRERVRGHLRAMRLMRKLLKSPRCNLRQRYLGICHNTLGCRMKGSSVEVKC